MQDQREERARAMEEMKKQLEEYESNCEHLRGNIQELEFLCRKKKQMLLGDDKQDGEQVRDQLALPAPPSHGQDLDKRHLNPAGSAILGKPRFMTATTSSRLKGRTEGRPAGTLSDGKGEKPTKPQKRHSQGGIKRRGAKVSPLDSNLPFESGLIPEQKLTQTTHTQGSEAKLIQKLAGLSTSPSSKAMYDEQNLISISRHQERINHKSSNLHEQVKKTIKSSTIMRRRLTVECSGQITVNTRF